MNSLDAGDIAPRLQLGDRAENERLVEAEVPNRANDEKFVKLAEFLQQCGVPRHMAETIF